MKNTPTLSIITIYYNIKDEIERTCESIINQSWQGFEWIVVDGGSTDGTLDVLEKYKNRINIFISEKDNGVYNAMNKGIKRATGEWLNFMNGGDCFAANDVLEKVFVGRKYNADVLYGNVRIKELDGASVIRKYTDQLDIKYFQNNTICHQASFIRRCLFDKYGMYDEHYRFASDWEKFIVFCKENCCFKYLNFLIANFYRGGISDDWRNNNKHIIEKVSVLDRHYLSDDVLKFSIVIACYNGKKYLSKCLDSVINQTLKDIEIICVNDGSTDGSLEILKEYSKKDKRIKIIDQKNQGLSCSRNNAMQIAKGTYVFFLDADDWIKEDTLDILYANLRLDNLDMLSYGGVNVNDTTGQEEYNAYYQFEYLPKNFKFRCFSYKQCKSFITRMAISSCLTCYRRQFLQDNNITFPPHLFFEDNVFFPHALLSAERCGICKETLYFRRIHSKQITNNWSKHFSDYIKICQMVIDLIRQTLVDKDIKKAYYEAYTKNPVSKYKNFGVFSKIKYRRQLQQFLRRNHKTRTDKETKKWLLFSVIPVLSIEDK